MQELYSLYPNTTQKSKDEYYATVGMSDDGTATLFLWSIPVCIIKLSNMKVIFIKPNITTKEKKIVSDFKKFLNQQESYTDLVHYLYFNGKLVDFGVDGVALFDELYQLLEDAKANNEPVDIPNCYLSRVPVVVHKDGSPTESLWEDERIYFRVTKPGTTIDDMLDIMDDALMNIDKE